jgi:hypothetical protein
MPPPTISARVSPIANLPVSVQLELELELERAQASLRYRRGAG